MSSIFNQSIDTSHERRVEQITTECRGQGIELLDVKNVPLRDVSAVKSSIGSTVTSLVGGKAQYDFLQIYTMRQGNELQYYFQPFSGLTPLPGQHFKVISGSLKYPIQYGVKKKKSFSDGLYELIMDSIPIVKLKKIRVCEWICEAESEKANLKGIKLPVYKEISNVWQTGTTLINLEWTLQACAIDKAHTLLSMQTGKYGALSEKSGLNQFKQFCGFASNYVEHSAGDGSINALITNSFLSSIFKKNYLSGPKNDMPADNIEWLYTNKVQLIINNLKKFNNLKKLYLIGDINEKKLANLKEFVLDKYGINRNEVIAAIPMDLLGNMKSAAVFTADKLYISSLDEYEYCIDLNNVTGFNGTKGFTESSMELVLADGSVTEVQIELASEVMKAFFTQFCYM